MIIVINNGLFANTLKQYLLEQKQSIKIIDSKELNLEELENEQPSMIIISNGIENKDVINNSIKVAKRFAWRIPIFSIGIGAIAVGILFSAKVVDSKIPNLQLINVSHDKRTIFRDIKDTFQSTMWSKYTISDEMIKNTDLKQSATCNGEIVAFRHNNLAIEGVLFDITSISCDCGKQILNNFISYYR